MRVMPLSGAYAGRVDRIGATTLATRLFASTCLVFAIGTALGSTAALAGNPLPLALIGALVPAQDEEAEANSEAQLAQDESADEETAQGEDAETEDSEAAAVEEESEAAPDEAEPDTDESAQDESAADVAEDVAPEEPPVAPQPEPTPTPQPAAAPAPITPSDRSAGTDDAEDTTIYNVVINHEEQYSIWPAHKETPAGWTNVGAPCRKSECLARIKEIWTDMRPLSLRKKLEEAAKGGQ